MYSTNETRQNLCMYKLHVCLQHTAMIYKKVSVVNGLLTNSKIKTIIKDWFGSECCVKVVPPACGTPVLCIHK